jgi:polyphenol oxidase
MSEPQVLPELFWHPPLALPPGVHLCQTLRGGEGWGFNLATHVGAPANAVANHRARLLSAQPGLRQIQWLTQVHGTQVVQAPASARVEADALWTSHDGVACAVMTADCLPVLLWSDDGTVVAAAHAGWRGLVAGVLEATVSQLPLPPQRLSAWLGPRIGPSAFEVGPEVRAAFVAVDAGAAAAFKPSWRAGHHLADLAELARQRLTGLGIADIRDSGACTVTDASRWFSFRRDGRCGRMASLIWRTAAP